MTWTRIFLIVSIGSAAGTGFLAPAFFRHIIPWMDVEPRGVATLFGAGVLLGGGLATFAVALQALSQTRNTGS